MSALRRIVAVLILGAFVMIGIGCTPTDLSDLAQAEDPTPAAAPSTAPLTTGSPLSEIDEFSVLPFFVPTMGTGTQATDCELSDDPYSSCI